MTLDSRGIFNWSFADPRLLTPPDLIHEHRVVHGFLVLSVPGPHREFLLFRHELLRIAANARSGMKHSDDTTLNQQAHPSPVSLKQLRAIDDRYHQALLVYSRWCYIRKARDVETINLLFHALMSRMPVEPERFYGEKTPWRGSTPGRYLWEYHNRNGPRTETLPV